MKVVVEADGGSRGNPGPAGYGAVVLDAQNSEVLAERKEGVGNTTNNVAEYRGLIAGLEAARDLGADSVAVRMDSKLVVEQMSGRWQIKHPSMKPLAEQAKALVAGFDEVTFEWIPRELNKHADRLANEAMDAQAEGPQAEEPQAGQPAEAAKPVTHGWTGATGTPVRFVLLRHGQTARTAERRYSGRGQVSLTELGEQQAAAAANRLGKLTEVAAVVTSPLTRTVQTGQAVADALGLELTTHDGLIETDFGEWEGLTFTEAAQRDPELHRRWLSDTSVPPPGGESFDTVHRRVRGSRDDLISRYGGSTIVVVSHVTPIKSVLRMALDTGPSLLFRLHLDTASISIADFYPDGNASVRLVNDTSHLNA